MMLSDEQIQKHVNTIMLELSRHAKTKRDEEVIVAGIALFASIVIALHRNARK